jgi:hypothetical protein
MTSGTNKRQHSDEHTIGPHPGNLSQARPPGASSINLTLQWLGSLYQFVDSTQARAAMESSRHVLPVVSGADHLPQWQHPSL